MQIYYALRRQTVTLRRVITNFRPSNTYAFRAKTSFAGGGMNIYGCQARLQILLDLDLTVTLRINRLQFNPDVMTDMIFNLFCPCFLNIVCK